MNEQMYLDWIELMEYEAEIALATINDEYMKQCETLLPF